MEVINEARLFSAQAKNPAWLAALTQGSVSQDDVKQRISTYGKVFSRYQDYKASLKLFSGLADTPMLANQYFNATMASWVRSFAGFLSIERDMDQETALLNYLDLLGVTDNRRVLPNWGPENLRNINARFVTTAPLIVGQTSYTVATGKKLLPGSVEIKLVHVTNPNNFVTVRDDRKGNLIAPAGILAAGLVDYSAAGRIEFTLGDGFVPETNDTFSIIAYEDVAGNPEFNQIANGNNRFKLEQKYIQLTAEPDLLIGESNLMSIATMNKSMGVNPQDVLGAKLTELYTKLVNQKLVAALQINYEGNVHEFDITTWQSTWYDYNSQLNAFIAELVNVDTELARKSVKGVQATAYVVGSEVGNWFMKCKGVGAFTPVTDSTYVNDLLGYLNGVPVLRHLDIAPTEGYAVHKTRDGYLAPLMRGIYLPLTNTPAVGSYQNPTQFAQGVYYQECNDAIVPELVQKFRLV